jgi:hypothetical protein
MMVDVMVIVTVAMLMVLMSSRLIVFVAIVVVLAVVAFVTFIVVAFVVVMVTLVTVVQSLHSKLILGWLLSLLLPFLSHVAARGGRRGVARSCGGCSGDGDRRDGFCGGNCARCVLVFAGDDGGGNSRDIGHCAGVDVLLSLLLTVSAASYSRRSFGRWRFTVVMVFDLVAGTVNKW